MDHFRSPDKKKEYLTYYDREAASWPVPSEERYIQTQYGSTFVRICSTGPPLLMLPGAGGNGVRFFKDYALNARHYLPGFVMKSGLKLDRGTIIGIR